MTNPSYIKVLIIKLLKFGGYIRSNEQQTTTLPNSWAFLEAEHTNRFQKRTMQTGDWKQFMCQ